VRSGAYFAQPGTAFADHNALLTDALDVEDRVYVDQIVVVRARALSAWQRLSTRVRVAIVVGVLLCVIGAFSIPGLMKSPYEDGCKAGAEKARLWGDQFDAYVHYCVKDMEDAAKNR